MNVNAHEIQYYPRSRRLFVFSIRLNEAHIPVILFIAIINKINLSLLLHRRSAKGIVRHKRERSNRVPARALRTVKRLAMYPR